jgi:general secretion pathway protein F
MAMFDYRAEGARGDAILGQLTASDEAAARRELESRGLTVLEILPSQALDRDGTLRDEGLSTLIEAVGGAAASRLPVEITLAALAEESNDRRLADAAQHLASRIEQGATIEQAIAGLDGKLPSEVAGVLRAGIECGDLAGTMERLTQHRMEAQRTRRKIQSAIAYPLVIAAILVPLLLFLSIYLIPMFEELFRAFEFDLPVITQVVFGASKQIPMLVFGILVMVWGIPIFLRLVGGRWLFHRVRSALPMLGTLWMWSGQREFAALLASFIDLRIPMVEAVAYTGDAISDRNVGNACRRVARRLEAGETLSHSLGQSIHFDRSLVALVTWGERYGLLPEALGIAATLFDDLIEQYASLVRRILPPITFIFVLIIMVFVVISLMIPLVLLIQLLSQ